MMPMVWPPPTCGGTVTCEQQHGRKVLKYNKIPNLNNDPLLRLAGGPHVQIKVAAKLI